MALTNEDLQAIAGLLQPIHVRLDGVENRLDRLESETSALKAGQAELRKEVRKLD